MNIRLNKKGAALVSILIATAFVAILATSLMVMSISNYTMKVANATSKENFYEVEKNVDSITCEVRNVADASGNPDANIKKSFGVYETGTTDAITDENASKATMYSALKLANAANFYTGCTVIGDEKLATITTPNNDKIKIYGGPIEIDTKNSVTRVTLKSVKVEQESHNGFSNMITTDINYYAEKSGKVVSSGVGDCSFLMDSSISLNDKAGEGTKVNIFGDSILGTYNLKADNSGSVGGDTIVLNGDSVLNLCGDYCVVYGNIVLNDNAMLSVLHGALSVYGNITVKDNATFNCNCGELYMEQNSTFSVANSDNVYPAKVVDVYSDANPDGHKIISPENIDKIKEKLKLNDGDADNDGILPQITKANSQGKYFYEASNTNLTTYSNPDFYSGGDKYVCAFDGQDSFNADFKHMLIFNICTGDRTLDQTNEGTTIISKTPVKIGKEHGVSLTQMGEITFKKVMSDNSITVKAKFGNDEIEEPVLNYFEDDASKTVTSLFQYYTTDINGNTGSFAGSKIGYSAWQKDQY